MSVCIELFNTGCKAFRVNHIAFDLFSLFQIVKNWVKQLTRLRGYTDQMVEDANAIILTFGSFRLGVSIFPPCLTCTLSSLGYRRRIRQKCFVYVYSAWECYNFTV